MNQIENEFDAEWIRDFDAAFADDADYGSEDWSRPESSSLTWDEETVRDSHREIAYKARRASDWTL